MATTSEKRYNKVLDVIDKRLVPDDQAKKARGEVFTPLNLVREMLFGLRKSSLEKGKNEAWGVDEDGKPIEENPDDRVGGIPLEVWRNAESTFIDPANGIGNFPVVAFHMLDYQLGKHGKDPKYKGDDNKQKRRKYIVEKMLYMIEINKGNVNTSRKIFRDIAPGTEPNIVCANTLTLTDEKIKKFFGINQFTVVMGNPPFNEGGTHQSGSAIWDYFFVGDKRDGKKKMYSFPGALEITEPEGYITFVLAQGWRTPAYENVFSEVKANQITTLKILNTPLYFSINFPLDYFIIKKTESKGKTFLYNEPLKIFGDYDISKLDFIPNSAWDIFQRWQENNLKNIVVKRTHDTSSTKKIFSEKKTNIYAYPIIMNINEGGNKIKYSNVPHSLQNKVKVLLAFGSYLYPFIDSKGEYGMSENVFCIECDSVKDAKIVKDYLDNNKVKCLVNALKVSSYAVSNKLLSYLPDPREFNSSIEDGLLLKDKDDKFFKKCLEAAPKRRAATAKAVKTKAGGSQKRFNKTRKNKRT